MPLVATDPWRPKGRRAGDRDSDRPADRDRLERPVPARAPASNVTTQCSGSPYFSSRARYIVVRSVDEILRRLMSADNIVTGANASSSIRGVARQPRRRRERERCVACGAAARALAGRYGPKRDGGFGIERNLELSQPDEALTIARHACQCHLLFGVGEGEPATRSAAFKASLLSGAAPARSATSMPTATDEATGESAAPAAMAAGTRVMKRRRPIG